MHTHDYTSTGGDIIQVGPSDDACPYCQIDLLTAKVESLEYDNEGLRFENDNLILSIQDLAERVGHLSIRAGDRVLVRRQGLAGS